MSDLYESIRKSMFAYFCKHHSNIIEEKFAVPRKVKIAKKSQRGQPKRYYNSEDSHTVSLGVRLPFMDAQSFHGKEELRGMQALVGNSSF